MWHACMCEIMTVVLLFSFLLLHWGNIAPALYGSQWYICVWVGVRYIAKVSSRQVYLHVGILSC